MWTLTNSGKLIEKIESLEPVEYSAWAWIDITDNKISADIWTWLSFSWRLPSAYQEVEYIESWADWQTQNVLLNIPYDWWVAYDIEIDFSNVWDAEWNLFTMTQSF